MHQGSRVIHDSRDSRAILDEPAPPADARIPYGPLPLQFGDLRLPGRSGPYPVAVMVHGGRWQARFDLAHVAQACAALTAALGVATWSLEFRRVGDEGGGWPGTFEDVARGADHVRALASRYPLDLERVVYVGHSSGGHLALWLAARRRLPPTGPLSFGEPVAPRAVVPLAGVLDLHRAWELGLRDGVGSLLGGSPLEVPERYTAASPAARLPLGVPQVIVHGTQDERVPYALAQGYAHDATRAGDAVDLVTLEGAGHFAPIDPHSPHWPAVLRAVERALTR